MADLNVDAPADQAPKMAPHNRTDDQILPHIRWVQIGKNNCYLDVERSQSNPIYKIAVAILKHTNFFRAFTASSTIPSIYIQQFWDISKHKFHPRPDSPLNFPNEEPVLGYLKFNAKGTKREVFGMPIPNKLITVDIQGEPYYKEYIGKVAKHQRYLTSEKGSDLDSLALKPTKATKKSTPSGKKSKLVMKTSDKPSPARRSKPGLVTKRRKPTSSLRSVDESVDEVILEKEPIFDDEEADVQRELGERLKSVNDVPRGLLPPVVIREPESGKYQPLLETPKKKSPVESSGHDESSSLYVKLGLTDSEVESNEDVPGIDAGVPDKGQARPNPGEQDEVQAGPNPGDAVASQPQSTLVVHTGPNLEHIDLEATDVSTQPHHEQMDEGFTITTYPNVHKNLKLSNEEHVILEEPASSTGTLSSLQHLAKDLSFGDLFFNDKLSEADNEKTTTETKAESMHIGELEQIMANLIQDNKNLEERLDSYGACIYTLENLDIPQQVSKVVDEIVTDEVDWAIQDLLRNRFREFPKADMKEILHQQIWETNSYKANEDHMMLYEALEKSMNHDHTDELLKDLDKARKKKKRDMTHRKRHLGLHLISHLLLHHHQVHLELQDLQELLDHNKFRHYLLHLHPSTKKPSVSSTPEDLHMYDDMAPNAQVHSSDDEDIRNVHIPKNNWASALASTYSPPPEDSLLTHTSEGDRRAVRTHIRILSVVKIEVFSMYGYDYIKKIVLRRADLNEHIITVRDFKYLYPSDFEDLQRIEDLLLGIESYQTQLNLTKHRWAATGFEYKHDYTVIDSPRAVTFQDKYGVQMIMQFNKIHKFSDGTLHQIDEALDYRVKEFKKRIKTRRIFRNLESFVGGRVAVCSGVRLLKPKRTIESRAKKSSKIISLGYYSIMIASSHTVKSKTDTKSHTHYPRGKENGVNILNSIDEGPFQMGTVQEPLVEGTEGAHHLGPKRPRVYSDLYPEEKDRYNADIKGTNILLQELPKDIYTLINHYTDAKDI
uniref:Histone deacetylase 14 n=1 Tax=Tanacetum cinerariifolium TaxID=118510 RepID=A0A6L2PCG7_TANCI|nr:histone deacetylase 14 [Tanacetum cinerariifolium]